MIVWIQHWLLQETGPFLDNSPAAIRFSAPEFPTIHPGPAGIEIGMLDCVRECSVWVAACAVQINHDRAQLRALCV